MCYPDLDQRHAALAAEHATLSGRSRALAAHNHPATALLSRLAGELDALREQRQQVGSLSPLHTV